MNNKSRITHILYSFVLIEVQRDFLKTMFSRFILYRHNAAIGTDGNLFWGDNL